MGACASLSQGSSHENDGLAGCLRIMSKVSYRSDIDGLRALAVVPVVLYHAGVPGFSGGYVGVDVFFVISGFLITQIIAREIDDGTFSIAGFYVRRIRRIFPALMVMLAVTLVAGGVLFLPEDYEKLGLTSLAALFSASNVLFFLQAGYFDDSALMKPLLHTWSLAVEEQFYFYLPLLLLATKKSRPGPRRLVILFIAGASLALAVIKTPDNQSYAFYRLPPRAWELLAGSLLALGALPPLKLGWVRETFAMSGAAFILAPVILYSEGTLFPGLGAVPPVFGAALLLHCAPGTLIGRTLSLMLPRAIGQISYSLYLWHWPAIVFTTYYLQAQLSPATAAGVISASVLLAVASWKFVERPSRRAAGGAAWRVFTGAAVAIAVIGSASAGVVYASGVPARFSADLAPFSDEVAVSPLRQKCHDDPKNRVAPSEACRLGRDGSIPSLAVWSDSHGVELAYALGEEGERDGFSLLQFTSSACPPSIAPSRDSKARPDCISRNNNVLDRLRREPAIVTIVLTASWEGTVSNPKLKQMTGMKATAKALRAAGKTVIFVGPTVTQPFDVPRRLKLAAASGKPMPAGRKVSWFLQKNKKSLRFLKNLEEEGIPVVLPHKLFCGEAHCPAMRDGKMLYFDNHHPSLDAGRMITKLIVPLLPKPLPSSVQTSGLP
jgi:peptidoglycan/LPS O-acetylase OafA/YrhL